MRSHQSYQVFCVEQCADIKIKFWDTAQYFHSKQPNYSFEKIFSLKFCDLFVHASFTKYTGPAKFIIKQYNDTLKKLVL